jgi:preprotein translocase subunit SecE
MSVTSYFKEVRSEMKHVSWPTRRLTIVYTVVVIGVSLGVAVYLGLLDYIFAAIIQKVI